MLLFAIQYIDTSGVYATYKTKYYPLNHGISEVFKIRILLRRKKYFYLLKVTFY